MVRAMLRLSETPEPADASDALAVALCHIQVAEAQARMAAGFGRASIRISGRAPAVRAGKSRNQAVSTRIPS
jgi:crossover junction endodeoxyribonuclease RuvC